MHIKSFSLTACITLLLLATSSTPLYADAVFQSQANRALDLQVTYIATKRGPGSSRNGRDSAGRRLGVKNFGSQEAQGGRILTRQRGIKFNPGTNVGIGSDHTIFD